MAKSKKSLALGIFPPICPPASFPSAAVSPAIHHSSRDRSDWIFVGIFLVDCCAVEEEFGAFFISRLTALTVDRGEKILALALSRV